MTDSSLYPSPSRLTPETHKRGRDKLSRLRVKVIPKSSPIKKPAWIRAKIPVGPTISDLKRILRQNQLVTVCEEACCPNLGECFNNGTATFMIMGDICTRRCPFCDVAHGRPYPLNVEEPVKLANTIKAMKLKYVVVTSVDRDDLKDGGASHFVACMESIRQQCPGIKIEILAPDFRGRLEQALVAFNQSTPDVFNHNLETVPRLYKKVRPGADYDHSLSLLAEFKRYHRQIPTKSGLMLGLGELFDEVKQVMVDLRERDCGMLTLGQYLQPSPDHLSVERYLTPQEFERLADIGYDLGFSHVASGPMVRSSYHADKQLDNSIRSSNI